MKYLITGGKGYIGENIIKAYSLSNKFDVCDYNTGGMLAHKLREEDVKEYDGIIHLAALSGLAACEKDPFLAWQDNVITAMNVFSLAAKLQIPVVFTSSQAAKDPKSSKYANIKWACEQMAYYYNNSDYKASIYVLRLANVYGGYRYLKKKQTCVKQFITKYNNNEPLIIHGDGTQTRDFIHVNDVCRAIMKVLLIKPYDKSPMDIGTGRVISILELKDMFPRKINQHYEFQKVRNVGTDSSIADTKDAMERIGFKAELFIEDYIKEMVK